ncbi:MAG: DUF2520 domain-containing protein [Cyclobacteriaceae bacterium]
MSVSIIGSGNVAFHLFKALEHRKVPIDGIFCRNVTSTSNHFGIEAPISDDRDLRSISSEIILICVKDEAIQDVLLNYSFPKTAMLVHTAGSVSMDVFDGFIHGHGVLYPLQTFSRNREINFSQVPLLLEADNEKSFTKLEGLAGKLSKSVSRVESAEREQIHIAAVILNNFTNFLFYLTDNHLDRPLHIFKPLIQETIKKAMEDGPMSGQTGPAIRGDLATINRHLELLNKDIGPTYKFLSQQIIEMMGHHKE